MKINSLNNFMGTSSNDLIKKVIALDLSSAGGDYWTTKTNSSTARNAGGSFSLAGFMYYVEGVSNPSQVWVSANDRYDDQFDTWSIKSSSLRNYAGIGCFALSFGYVSHGDAGSNSGSIATLAAYNEISDSWLSKASSAAARKNVASVSLNGFGYVLGGSTGTGPVGPQNINERYDELLNSWSTKSVVPVAQDLSPGLNIRGYAIVVGGRFGSNSSLSNNAIQYNDSTNSWVTLSGLISSNKTASFAFASNEFAFASGGFESGGSLSSSTDRFDPVMGNWSPKMTSPVAIEGAPGNSTTLNGSGYIANGYAGASVSTNYLYRLNNIRVINETMYKSTKAPKSISILTSIDGLQIDLPVQLQTDGTTSFRTIISNADNVLRTGDINVASAFATNANGIREYNIKVGLPARFNSVTAGFWISVSNLNTGVAAPASFTSGGNGYIAGGYTGSTTSVNQKYDDFSNSWSVAMAITARTNLSGFSQSGAGYIIGGTTTAASASATDLSQKYVHETNTVTSIASEPVAAGSAAGVSLNGFGYEVGGAGTDGINTQNNFKYDESADSWSVKTAALTIRGDAAAWEHNGISYFAYGTNGARSTVTESYNDATDVWTNKAPTGGAAGRYGISTFTISGRAILSTGNTAGATAITEEYVDTLNAFIARSDNPISTFSGKGFSLNKKGYTCGGNGSISSVSKYATDILIPKLIVKLIVDDIS